MDKGAPNIWLIDPRLQTMPVSRRRNLNQAREMPATDGEPRIEFTRGEIFQG